MTITLYQIRCEFFKDVFHLPQRQSERKRETEIDRDFPSSSSFLQMATTTRVGPERSQKLRTQGRSPKWVAGGQELGPTPVAFPGTLAGTWIRSGAGRT